jgi:hypothetical protein
MEPTKQQQPKPRRRDDNSGKYAETYPPEAFTDAIRENGGMAGTNEVAKAVGCVYDTAYKKLRSLEEEDRVSSKRVANARLWLVADDGAEST